MLPCFGDALKSQKKVKNSRKWWGAGGTAKLNSTHEN